jgi:hypothetical protein
MTLDIIVAPTPAIDRPALVIILFAQSRIMPVSGMEPTKEWIVSLSFSSYKLNAEPLPRFC